MKQRGFSLLELMVVVAVFTIVTGVAFGLLNVAQQRYKMESEFLDSFQGARIALDQIIRDVHSSGYPPIQYLPTAVATATPNLVAFPFAWNPGYPNPASCSPNAWINNVYVGGNCNVPGDYDLIVETDIDPQNNNGVEWIRYSLQGTTLFRAVVSKQAGVDPVNATNAALVPYVENVINIFNNVNPVRRALIQGSYPNMFPGGAPVPVFRYVIMSGQAQQSLNIREVGINLIVMAPNLDPRNRQVRVMSLTGLARRFNP